MTKVKEAFPNKKKFIFRINKFKIVKFVAEIFLPCIYLLFAIGTNAQFKDEFFS